MNGRTIVTLFVAGGAAFALLMMWWARAVGFPHHPKVSPAPAAVLATTAGPAPAPSPPPSAPAPTATAAPALSAPAASAMQEGAEQKQARMLQAVMALQKRNTERYTRALQRWAKEKRDAAWAGPRESALRLALEHDSIEITPDQLECRATLCRLLLHLPNPLGNAREVSREIGAVSAIGSEGEGPSRSMIVFIPRAGQSLDG